LRPVVASALQWGYVKISATYVCFIASVTAFAQPGRYTQFNPKTDCEKTPMLIRDAAKDARIDIRRICYITDRGKFASKAGVTFAHDLDRIGNLVRVAVPFGHLLLVNGTEPAIQMAVRFYEYENEVRLRAARFAGEPFLGGPGEVASLVAQATASLRTSYTAELAGYKDLSWR
jgi:hypothetical protein